MIPSKGRTTRISANSAATIGLSRRGWLQRSALGFGELALLSLLSQEDRHAYGAASNDSLRNPPHRPPRARNVIFCFMEGGVSQMDCFDPKPRLDRDAGKPFPLKIEPTQFDQVGRVKPSHWKFQQHGECGMAFSDLFPHIGSCADELCMIRSMTTPFAEHTQATSFLHTGHSQLGRPSLGAWTGYGLGSDCADLPEFIVLHGGMMPQSGFRTFSSGFLPATHSGSLFNIGTTTEDVPVLENLDPSDSSRRIHSDAIDFIGDADERFAQRLGAHGRTIDSAIANFELACRMQTQVPDVVDLSDEDRGTLDLYGVNSSNKTTATYARQCLIARRLVERGVRFIELTCAPGPRASTPWDSHGNLKKQHGGNALGVDQPIAGLLKDLKRRGLLDQTLVLFGSEFGRTPFGQGTDGRDHNPFGFTIWMSGGGTKGGLVYGATDEYGYRAVENPVEIHDLQATILHLLGLDHERLTYRYGGRDFRLTDVAGHVLRPLLA